MEVAVLGQALLGEDVLVEVRLLGPIVLRGGETGQGDQCRHGQDAEVLPHGDLSRAQSHLMTGTRMLKSSPSLSNSLSNT